MSDQSSALDLYSSLRQIHKAYDADSLRNWLKQRRNKAVIPSTATLTRSTKKSIDAEMSSGGSSANSKTGGGSQLDMTYTPKTTYPPSHSQP